MLNAGDSAAQISAQLRSTQHMNGIPSGAGADEGGGKDGAE
jgi:hypothetical protein